MYRQRPWLLPGRAEGKVCGIDQRESTLRGIWKNPQQRETVVDGTGLEDWARL